ncbi:Fic family protein [Idiomarina abyssalis]|uniref:Fic family protein n=1 Tax=Idiomarina abyssalis TaxID=86102 RepID=A0A8I1GBF7_9GAMM|nr:Fic family protein [Idiomarina abyssalis]MBJ7265848.1 Fic family protein [Idiomarina abyssalis]MBJ7274779.1 Fic family protein [Idiomarina abyssalis]MBJ7315847.1 Fic family protein [Idiomarina abyssalis]
MATPDYLITSRCVNLVAQISTEFGRWLALLESEGSNLAEFQSQQMPLKVFASVGIEEQSQLLQNIRLNEAYTQLAQWSFSSEADLKNAHQLVCAGVTPSAGSYRATGMGVYQNNKLVHMTAPAGQARKSVRDLLNWLQQSDEHPLLKAAIFLQQFEFIQPFSVANGCIGRLWFSLILADWHPAVAWLSFEETFKASKDDYLDCLRRSIAENDKVPMVEFVLSCMQQTISRTVKSEIAKATANKESNAANALTVQQAEGSVKSSLFCSVKGSEKRVYSGVNTRNMVLRLLNEQPDWSAARVAEVLNISSRAVEKHISKLKDQGLLVRKGSARGGYWRVTTEIEEQLSLPADWN